MSEAIITEKSGGVTFIQVWAVDSPDHQTGMLEVMHRSIGILARQPGFVSMTLHVSLDGTKIAVYAQWVSEGQTSAAVNLPEAKRAHDEMTEWGRPEGAFYRVDAVFLPAAALSK